MELDHQRCGLENSSGQHSHLVMKRFLSGECSFKHRPHILDICLYEFQSILLGAGHTLPVTRVLVFALEESGEDEGCRLVVERQSCVSETHGPVFKTE